MPGLYTVTEPTDIKAAEERLVSELRQRAKRQIEGISGDTQVHIRDILPDEDLESGADNGWNGTDRDWAQDGLTALTQNEVYTIDPNEKMEGKIIGFFAISSIATEILTNEVILEDGTGSTFERLQFEEARTLSQGEYALMRNPVIINAGKEALIHLYPDSAGDEQIVLHGAIAEKAGRTIGTRSEVENAPTGTARQPTH